MGNLPSKFYIVQLQNNDLVGIFSNKKRLFESLAGSDIYRLSGVHSYQAFSELLKWNKRCMFSTGSLPIVVVTVTPNIFRS